MHRTSRNRIIGRKNELLKEAAKLAPSINKLGAGKQRKVAELGKGLVEKACKGDTTMADMMRRAAGTGPSDFLGKMDKLTSGMGPAQKGIILDFMALGLIGADLESAEFKTKVEEAPRKRRAGPFLAGLAIGALCISMGFAAANISYVGGKVKWGESVEKKIAEKADALYKNMERYRELITRDEAALTETGKLFAISNNYEIYEGAVNPHDPRVKEAARAAIKGKDISWYNKAHEISGDIYDWFKKNIHYNDSDNGFTPSDGAETIKSGSGDCKDQSVALASMFKSFHNADTAIVFGPGHVFVAVLIPRGANIYKGEDLKKYYEKRYGREIRNFNYYEEFMGTWLFLDPITGDAPGQIKEFQREQISRFMVLKRID
ncbi:MAG: transglutaminase domain-containing protein [Candidatus Bilamarchaeaceae archaeon]